MKNQWLKNKTIRDAKEIKGAYLISDYDVLTKILKYSDDTTADILQRLQKRTTSPLDLIDACNQERFSHIYRLSRKRN